jgi:hypothetical protein
MYILYKQRRGMKYVGATSVFERGQLAGNIVTYMFTAQKIHKAKFKNTALSLSTLPQS